MIHITRNLARVFRALVRRAKLHKTYGGFGPNIHLSSSVDGLRIHSQNFDVAITHFTPSPGSEGELWLPINALDDFYGKDDSRVSLASAGKHRASAQWTDRGIPHANDYEFTPPKTVPDPPASPTSWASFTPEQWHRLGEATKAADESSTRYALGCLQLQGELGRVSATDGRQVVMQTGYQFGFTDEVLIQASGILGSNEVAGETPVQVGRSNDWVTFVFGPWSLSLRVQKEGRFPNLDTALPKQEAVRSRLILADNDAEFLLRSLPSLPGADEANAPVTLDMRNGVCVRGRSDTSQRTTELVLSHSRFAGDPVAINSNRDYLIRAIQLGYREIGIANPELPVTCDNESGRYAWATLTPEGVIKPTDSAIRIESASITSVEAPKSKPRNHIPVKTNQSKPQPDVAVVPAARPSGSVSSKSSIEQALALRDTLQAAARQANELAKALKRQRRESQLIRSTLASLQQLEKAAA